MGGPVSATPGGIFISYRRQETAFPAGWLYDRLRARFGPNQIFKDVDNIDPGDDFIDKITTAVGSCDVLLALIGRGWLTITDDTGRRRLDDPEDFVRVEIEAALSRKVRVVPLLIDGATMPRPDQLPPSLAQLVRRQAQELSPSRFDADANRLFGVLDRTLTEARTQREAEEGARRQSEQKALEAEEDARRQSEQKALEAEEDARRQAEQKARTRADERARREAEEKARVQRESQDKARREAEARARPEAEPPAGAERESKETARRAGEGISAPPVPPPVEGDEAGTPPRALSRKRTLIGVAIGALLVPVLISVVVKVAGSTGGSPSPASSPAASAASASPSPSPTPATFGVPPVLAHRGGEEVYPAETIAAFDAAAKNGYAIETDVRWTRDGVPVLIHNDDLTDGVTCTGRYSVADTDWSTLRKRCHPISKNGQKVYPLAEYQEAVDTVAKYPDAQFFPEVKVNQTSQQVQQYLKALEDADLTARTVVTSFKPEELAKIRAQAQIDQIKIRLMLFQQSREPMSAVQDKGLWAVAVEKQVVTRSYVSALHKLGLKVVVWTVNGDWEWASAMATGADVVLTDYPKRYLTWKASQ
jgi:glycerophosphoryl diester phosphodiesterase